MGTAETARPPQGRLVVGGGIFVVGLLCPVFVPVVIAIQLPTAWKTVLSGLLLLGIPELFMVVAVAVLGKPGFNYLKARIFGFFKRIRPTAMVSPRRHRIGLIMFLLPMLFGWLAPYVTALIPPYRKNPVLFALGGDLLLLASLFVLGGDFWDKLRTLFVHQARVDRPNE